MVHFSFLPLFLPEPECGTCDKLLALACGDGYMRGVDIRSRKTVSGCYIYYSIQGNYS